MNYFLEVLFRLLNEDPDEPGVFETILKGLKV